MTMGIKRTAIMGSFSTAFLLMAALVVIFIVVGIWIFFNDKPHHGQESGGMVIQSEGVTPKLITIRSDNVRIFYCDPPKEDDGKVPNPIPFTDPYELLPSEPPVSAAGKDGEDLSWKTLREILLRIEDRGISMTMDGELLNVGDVMSLVSFPERPAVQPGPDEVNYEKPGRPSEEKDNPDQERAQDSHMEEDVNQKKQTSSPSIVSEILEGYSINPNVR